MSEVLEIGYFQLENLQMNSIPFVFLDLRESKELIADEPLKSILSSSVPLDESEVLNYLSEKLDSKDVPVVLLCQNGEVSKKIAQDLESKGYINIHIIEGGLENLREDAQAATHS